jgi:hypothetical protein
VVATHESPSLNSRRAFGGFPRTCLIIDDNLQSAELVTLKDGEVVAGDPIQLIENSWQQERRRPHCENLEQTTL